MAHKVVVWIATAFVIVLGGVALFVTLFTNHVYVTTPSMYPTIPPGSMVFIKQESAYHVGDVIEFRGNGLVFMHRIIKINSVGNITTKGDNPENAPDAFFPATTKADVVGKAVLAPRWLRFPELIAHHPGYGLSWLRAELGLAGELAVLGVGSLLSFGLVAGSDRHGHSGQSVGSISPRSP